MIRTVTPHETVVALVEALAATCPSPPKGQAVCDTDRHEGHARRLLVRLARAGYTVTPIER